MEIKINLESKDIDKILGINGYVTESVTLWYDCSESDKKEMECLCPISQLIAYKADERPSTLVGNNPRLEENKEHLLDNVIQRLFNERLMRIMF